MPHKAPRPCRYPPCVNTALAAIGYCESHAHYYQPPQRHKDTRPSSSARGYNKEWQRIRAEVLRNAGIPREAWHLYDIHHQPEYNPAIDSDHRNYTLTPMLHGEHSRETGRSRGVGGKSLEAERRDRTCPQSFFTSKMGEGA